MKTKRTMKALRYLLVVMVVWLAPLPAKAQFSQTTYTNSVLTHNDYQFRSTSAMASCGSQLPLAAVSGTSTAAYTPAAYAPYVSRPRRIGEDEGFDENDSDENEPELPGNPFPVGEGTWVLLLLAAAYGVLRLRMLRSAVAEEVSSENKPT